ncbi:hypothetical protein J8628_15040 [Serratia fonticola]|uniref:hypothetical protein n=1 Tax=Serratia fonticola TaxID=47917 RepID=UPI001AE8541A|nr:hypothetical protein [Serratia fonticola]MBP1018234.1 hypothetical protein [Serratia fonticola]
MTSTKAHLARINKLRHVRNAPALKSVATASAIATHLAGEVDASFVDGCQASGAYRSVIEGADLTVSNDDVMARLDAISTGSAIDNILEPVFLSLLDGTMRACNIGTRQGITPSRLYHECRAFSYQATDSNGQTLDSYSEHLNERQNIERFSEQSSFNGGEMTRNDESLTMRDGAKMKARKESHFSDNLRAVDEYGNGTIYQYKKHAKSEGQQEQAAEVDHVLSCAEVCNNLKSNKALKLEDIKSIVNIDENYAVTSMQNNRGEKTGKFAKSREELQQEIDQGYVVVKKGKKDVKHTLTEEEVKTRQTMVEKMDIAQKKIDAKTNETVFDNIRNDRDVQKVLAKDAAQASGHQSLGDLILFIIKPLYYELRTCLSHGIEAGVGVSDFSQALSIRLGRMKDHIMKNAVVLLKEIALGFIKNFLSMLMEGIVNCFVGVFKNIMRMVKEGFKVLMQTVPILRDKHSSMAQKGDAILKLVAGSLSVFAAIGLESWLSGLGLPGPLPILLSSVLTAVITALVMLMLDKLDLFGANKALKKQRIDELMAQEIATAESEMIASVVLLR